MHWIYAHLIGDYLIQNDWMALNKKKNSFACLAHVLMYLIPFLFTSLELWQVALIGSQHFIQDRTSLISWLMKVKGSASFMNPPMGPWSIIVTDNIVHVLFIAFIASL